MALLEGVETVDQLPGLNMGLGALPLMTSARTRSISAENPTGEKGKGGMAVPDPSSPEFRAAYLSAIPARDPDHLTLCTTKYGPAHLSLNPAPAWSSAPPELVAPPLPLIMSPIRQITVGDGRPPGPDKLTIRSVSPRLSVLKISLCHTGAGL